MEVVTHNAVGGGSDVFTRQMIKVMYENDIIDTPVAGPQRAGR